VKVNVEYLKELIEPFVKAFDEQVKETAAIKKEVKKQTAILQNMPESTGRNTAKWLERKKLPTVYMRFREEILLEKGYEPIEVLKNLYPNVTDPERTRIRKRLSKMKNELIKEGKLKKKTTKKKVPQKKKAP
jgi:hypothetical protein